MSKAFLLLPIMEIKEQKFTVELNEKDYIIYQTDHNQSFKSKRWIIYATVLLIIIASTVIPSIVEGNFSFTEITNVLPLLIPFLFVGFPFFSMKTRAKHSFKSDPFAHHSYDITINEKEIIANGYNGNINCRWEEIYRFNKTINAVYIYVSDLKSIIIPLRYLENNAQLVDIISFLTQKVNPHRYNALKRKTRLVRLTFYSILALVVLAIVFVNFDANGTDKESRAVEFENNGEYEKAKSIYSELISEFPKDEFYYVSRAYCEINLNEISQALTDCKKAIDLNPKSGRAYYHYAYALYNDGELDKACSAMHNSKELGFQGNSEGFCEDINGPSN